MTARRTIALRNAPGKSTAPAELQPPLDAHWRWRYVMLAPHRLGFFLAVVVLVSSGLWWALVQLDRSTGWLALPMAVPPTVVHSVVMVFGFIPLFFSGFLFTAGPKWLAVDALPVTALRCGLLAQAGGWLLWLVGGQWHAGAALCGLGLACTGLFWMTAQFVGLVRRSQAQDAVHARVIASACMLGSISLAGVGVSLWLDAYAVARAFIFTGLWGFVVVVYLSVAHRMIPFFTASAVPGRPAWRPFWVLWLLLAGAFWQVLAVWMEWGGGAAVQGIPSGPAWALVHGTVQLAVGGVLVWLSFAWGLVPSLKNKLLAMLHLGFAWLGVAFLLGGLSPWLAWDGATSGGSGGGGSGGVGALGLGALHALTMGCLASLMLAMVTRVSCGHSGRPLVADTLSWSLFLLLQAATVLRIAAAVPGMPGAALPWLLVAVAALWVGTLGVWGARLGSWYGRLRADGRPG